MCIRDRNPNILNHPLKIKRWIGKLSRKNQRLRSKSLSSLELRLDLGTMKPVIKEEQEALAQSAETLLRRVSSSES